MLFTKVQYFPYLPAGCGKYKSTSGENESMVNHNYANHA